MGQHFFFEGQVVQAARLLQRMNAGFHARLNKSVCERHEQQEIFTLADLRAYTLEEVETEEHGDAMFTFLSVVELLRQSLPNDVQTILADDIFLHETNLWNMLAGPTFRCELLVATQCSDEADDIRFSSRGVSWTDSVAHDSPLLVQISNSQDSLAA